MRKCSACTGQREFGSSPLRLPHAEACSGSVCPTNIGSPLCECTCTPAESKLELEREYRWRQWVAATERHPVTAVSVERGRFPIDNDFIVTIREDAHNATDTRLPRDMAEALYDALGKALGRK